MRKPFWAFAPDMRLSRTTLAVFALLASGGAPAAVHAQPPATESPSASEVAAAAAETAWAALRQEVQTLQITEPRAAVKKLETFYDKQGYKSGTVAVELTSLVAQIYYQELGDRDKALDLYEWGIKTFNVPGTARLQQERQIVENDAPAIVPTVTVGLAGPTAFAVPKDIAPPQGASEARPVAPVEAMPSRTAGPSGVFLAAVPFPVAPVGAVAALVAAGVAPVRLAPHDAAADAVPAAVASPRFGGTKAQMPLRVAGADAVSSSSDGKALPVMATHGPVLTGIFPAASAPVRPAPNGRANDNFPATVSSLSHAGTAEPLPPVVAALADLSAPSGQAQSVSAARAVETTNTSANSSREVAVRPLSSAPAILPNASSTAPLALQAAPPANPSADTPSAAIPPQVANTGAMLANSSFWLQLQATPGDAESLWTKAQPRSDELLAHLENASDNTPEHAAFRLALTGLLVKHGDELLKDTSRLTATVRLALADFYASAQDEKAVPLYEGLLAEIKKNGVQDAWVVELDKLANFYQNGGEYTKGAELLENVDQYTSRASMRGNLQIKAARLYQVAGEIDKAVALFQKVIDTPSDWGFARGLAIHDQASILIGDGKYEEARRLLETPVKGEKAELTRATILDLLGDSYFQTGDYDKARVYTEQSIAIHDLYKDQLKPVKRNTLTEAQVRLKTLDEWKTKAFELPLKAFAFGVDDVYHARIDIRSLKTQSIVVRFDDAKVSLVEMKLQSRRRLDSGVANEVYDLTYKVAVHPNSLRARIVSDQEPREEHSIDIMLRNEDGPD